MDHERLLTRARGMERGSKPRLRAVTHTDPLEGGTVARYCGPAAMSAATGQPAEVCNAWINYVRGRPLHYQSRGVYPDEVKEALHHLGWSTRQVSIKKTVREELRAEWPERVTLARWLRSRTGLDRKALYLLSVGISKPHYIAVQGQWTVDSHQNERTHVKDSRNRRKRIRLIELIEPYGVGALSADLRRKRTPYWPPADYKPLDHRKGGMTQLESLFQF